MHHVPRDMDGAADERRREGARVAGAAERGPGVAANKAHRVEGQRKKDVRDERLHVDDASAERKFDTPPVDVVAKASILG